MGLPCVVYNSTGPIEVRWYHSQNGIPAEPEELNITTGGRYTVEELEQSRSNSRYANCTEGDQLYWNTLEFDYSKADSGSYWCHIVIDGGILLKLSEPWTVVLSSSGDLTTCGTASQTDPKCVGQIIPILASTTHLVQNTPTHSPVQTHSSFPETPSASNTSSTLPSDATGCTLGGV